MNQKTTPPPPRRTYASRMRSIERIAERVLFFGSDDYAPRSYGCADAARESLRAASGGDIRLLAYAAYLVRNLHAPHGLPERIADFVRRHFPANDYSVHTPPFARDPKRRFLLYCLYFAGCGEKSFIFACGTWGKLAGLHRKEVYRFMGHAIRGGLLSIAPRHDCGEAVDFHGIGQAMPVPTVRRRKPPTVYRLGDWRRGILPFDDLAVLRVKPWVNSICTRQELLSCLGLDSASLRAMAQKRPWERAARKTGDEPHETAGLQEQADFAV